MYLNLLVSGKILYVFELLIFNISLAITYYYIYVFAVQLIRCVSVHGAVK